MSAANPPAHDHPIHPISASPAPTPNMAPQSVTARRPRPGNVNTDLPQAPNSQLVVIPPSAISNSSVNSSSHGSPLMSPETIGMTTNSSIVPSPEPFRGRDFDFFHQQTFQLPESVLLTHKTSATSLHQQPLMIGNGPTQDVAKSSPSGIMRRLSSRAANVVRGGRRTSSTTRQDRDVSVGPGIVRKRSASMNTPPALESFGSNGVHYETDSEMDFDEREDIVSLLNLDGAAPESPPTSAPANIPVGPATIQSGPVIPLALRKGTYIRKMSKKNSSKRINLILDEDTAKIIWDRSKPHKCIYIDDIKEIRIAEDIRQYRLDFGIPEFEEPLFFSILYTIPDKAQHKTMHLIADDQETFRQWTGTLDAMYKHRQSSMASLMAFNDKAVRGYWEREMKKQREERAPSITDDIIDFPGVERVCRNLHIHVAQATLRKKFDQADALHVGHLNFTEFQEFVRLMKKREDVMAVYRELASTSDKGITRDVFLNFLRETQGEDVDDNLAYWETVFSRFSRKNKTTTDSQEDEPQMSEAALASFLTSTYNLAIIKEPQEYTLDRPMNEYFISSSHNTYLLGRQVVGVSSVEGYISALMRGCRCVEIDCWDGPDGYPTVLHGRTWTSRISFREVINTINKYAFVKSRFPLWISLEVHCNPEQQRLMAKTMKEIFGAKMVTELLPNATDRIPTPSELKDRILIKAKKPRREEPAPAGTGRRRGNSLTSPYARPVPMDNAPVASQHLSQSSPSLDPHLMMRKTSTRGRVDTITEGQVPEMVSTSTSECDSDTERVSGKTKQSNIVPELGDLAVYCVGVKYSAFDDPDCRTFNHILSFVEGTFDKYNKPRESKLALFRHNMRHLMRVYPAQRRITSTNFNPLIYWRRGVQMSALNWQTFDLGMQLNQAMFDGGTDQSGYVLKAREFREIQVMPSVPGVANLKRERKNVSFSIDVISAQQLMKPYSFAEKRSLDPFVEVEVFTPDDKRDQESPPHATSLFQRTQVIRENGFNPTFDRRFNFNITTKYPDMVFVRWSVKLADNGKQTGAATTLGTFTAKLSSLKQGYRTIPLLDSNADRYLFSTLFCRIKIDPITSIYVHCSGDENANKFKSIVGRTVFNRSNPSPKSSVDSGPS